ncbi:MAG: hypothetical protein WC635_12860 [Bacteriovorax sp.]|jgi:hypothetical protein
MFSKLLLAFVLLSMLFPVMGRAHPVAYADSNSIMAWNSKEMSDWVYTHTFTPYYSLSARAQRINTLEGERTFYFPHLSFLLKRWNELDSQANIYLSFGHGGEKIQKSFKDISFLAFETDWESRKYYVSFREEALLTYKKNGRNLYLSKLRGGFAPYLAEFNELNSWFIVEVKKMNRGKESYDLTPYIRLFYHNVLAEVGFSHKGEAKFNFMVHY